MFYGHFCAHGSLNGRATSKGNEVNEVKDETPFRYTHGEIRTRVVVIHRATN